jgi:hypothetical protein
MIKIAAFAAILMLTSCSAGFNREWRRALADGRGSARNELTGAWQGTLRSEVNGHHGELRCIVSLVGRDGDAGGGGPLRSDARQTTRFHYHATFMKFLSATYDVTHQVFRTKEGFTFSGDQKLPGMCGGLYHYEGSGTPERFSATFRSAGDRGVFELKRP